MRQKKFTLLSFLPFSFSSAKVTGEKELSELPLTPPSLQREIEKEMATIEGMRKNIKNLTSGCLQQALATRAKNASFLLRYFLYVFKISCKIPKEERVKMGCWDPVIPGGWPEMIKDKAGYLMNTYATILNSNHTRDGYLPHVLIFGPIIRDTIEITNRLLLAKDMKTEEQTIILSYLNQLLILLRTVRDMPFNDITTSSEEYTFPLDL